MSSKSLTLAYFAAITTLLIWSGTVVANKIAVVYLDGFSVGVLRSVIAGAGAAICVGLFKLELPNSKKDKILLVLSGVASFAAWPILMSIGVQYTTAGHAALIIALIPILTVLIKLFSERALPSPWWLLGALLAFLATTILIFEQKLFFGKTQDTKFYLGDLVILFGSFLCAIGFVSGSHVSSTIGVVSTTFWGLVFSLIVAVPALFFSYSNVLEAKFSASFWLSIIWMAVMSSLLGYVLWFFALAQGGVKKIASLQLGMPVMSLVFAFTFLNEALSYMLVIVCATILVGVFIAQKYA